MSIKNKSAFFTNFAPRATVLIMVLSLIFSQGISFASLQNEDAVTREDFIQMLAKNQPENSLLPDNHSGLTKKALYNKVANTLNSRGINVLENKTADGLITQHEFIRITYTFAGGPKNKSLLEQKLFLKNAKILSTADIGLTTGVDGTVYQKHKGQSKKFKAGLAGPVFMDDQFETNETSKALFTFDDRSTLTMSEDTVININKHVYNPDKDVRETLINASMGWVRFKVTKKLKNGSTFKVVTPTATAGVRGTEFVVKVDPGGKTKFLVLEGQIETRPTLPNGRPGRVSFISAGETQDFLKGGVTSAVKKASAILIKTAQNKTTNPKKLAKATGITKSVAKSASKITKQLAKAEKKEKGKKDKKDKSKKSKNDKGKGKLAKNDKGKGKDKAGKKGKDKGAGKFAKKGKENGKGGGKVKGNGKTKPGKNKTAKATLGKQKSVKGSAKVSSKGSAKLTAKGSTKGAAKGSVKTAAKGSAKGSAKTAAKDSAKGAAKDSAKSAAKDSAKSAAKDSAKSAAKDSAKSAAKDSAKSAAKDSAKSAAKDSAKSAAKDSAKSAAKDSAKQAAKDSAKSAAKDSAKQAAKDSAKSAAKDSAKSAAKDSAKNTAKDTARQNAKKNS